MSRMIKIEVPENRAAMTIIFMGSKGKIGEAPEVLIESIDINNINELHGKILKHKDGEWVWENQRWW